MKLKWCITIVCLLLLGNNLALAQKKTNKKTRKTAAERVVSGEVQPTWESINERGYPQWFSDAKLGIFIHWGLYSVPAYAGKEGYAEWFYRGIMTNQQGRLKVMRHYADSSASVFDQYAALKDHWHAELWNPDQWAQLFKDAGAQYILLVTKHHDGYCLWDNQSTYDERKDWNSVKSGPHRDICAELSEAVRKKGIRFGAYYSLPEWSNSRHIWMEHPDDSIGNYVENYMIPQFKDMITRYRPEVLFTDGEWNNRWEDFHATELIAWYYNTIGPDAIVNNRWGAGEQHGFRTPEYSSGITMTDRPWAECRGLGRSFGFNRNEPLENYLSSDELIQHFAKLVSAGGGMTLNVGPYADGTIPLLQQERLLDLGNWLKTNGEAIYATRPWIRFNDTKLVSVSSKEKSIRHDWVRNSPDRAITYDNFSAIWNGTILPPATDDYTFELHADDSASVTIRDVDNPSAQNVMIISHKDTVHTPVHLEAGHRYLVFVNYYEQDLEARCWLTWKSHSMSERPVEAIDGWEVTYTCEQPYVCYTTKGNDLYAIVLGWQTNPLIPWDMTNLPKDMKVTMLGCEASIPIEKTETGIVLKNDHLTYDQITNASRAAWVYKLEGALKSDSQK